MSIMQRVNEGSSAQLVATFLDAAREEAVPQSVEYRVDCVENGERIRDWTSKTPAPVVAIDLTDEDNVSVLLNKGIERHEVTVRAGYGINDFITSKYVYEVANLRFLVP